MPLDLKTALIIKGDTLKLKHGIYPAVLFTSALKAAKIAPAKGSYMLVYFTRCQGVYPTLEAANLDGKVPWGGIARPCSAKLATYGVYQEVGGKMTLLYWSDFDHVPVKPSTDGGFTPLANMDRGHRHQAPRTQDQLPASVEDATLYSQLILMGLV